MKFSKLENSILTKLKGRMKISELAEKIFTTEDKPLNPNVSISNAITQINKKCKKYKTLWIIDGEGMGRNGKTVWLKKK